jgi:hypothetical protein
MNQPVGAILFVVAVVGNAVVVAIGLVVGLVVLAQRKLVASWRRGVSAAEHDRAFHHPDKIRTPLGEWLFMGGAIAVVLIGLPVVLGALFQFVLPVLGRAWTH